MSFLGGYLRAVFEKEVQLWEQTLESLRDGSLRKMVPELTCRSGMTENALNRIKQMMEKEEITIDNLAFLAFGGIMRSIPQRAFHDFVSYLINEPTGSGAEIALELTQSWYYQSNSRLNEQLTLKLLLHPKFWNDKNRYREYLKGKTEYNWKEIAEKLISDFPETEDILITHILEFFGDENTVAGGIDSQLNEIIVASITRNPRKVWGTLVKYLGPPADIRAFRLTHWLRGEKGIPSMSSILDLFDPDSIWAWVNEDKGKRAEYLATFVPPEFLASNNRVSLAREFLVRYGGQKSTRDKLRNNFLSGSWSGPESAHYLSEKTDLLNLRKTESNPNVIQWIEECIEVLDELIESSKVREEREIF
jgi:hypothetical protein